MAQEKFIAGKRDIAKHDGRRSEVRRIQSAMDQLRVWRQERPTVHETGHVVPDHPDILPADEPHVVYECKDIRYVLESDVVGYLTPEANLRRQIGRSVYNQSVSLEEDPRLKDH